MQSSVTWTDVARNNFNALTDAFSRATNLTIPLEKVKKTLATDASDTIIGAVLHQIVDTEKRYQLKENTIPMTEDYELYTRQ